MGSSTARLRLVPFNGGVLIHVIKHDLVQKASPVQYKAYSWAKATRGGGGGPGRGCPTAPRGSTLALGPSGASPPAPTITRIQFNRRHRRLLEGRERWRKVRRWGRSPVPGGAASPEPSRLPAASVRPFPPPPQGPFSPFPAGRMGRGLRARSRPEKSLLWPHSGRRRRRRRRCYCCKPREGARQEGRLCHSGLVERGRALLPRSPAIINKYIQHINK